MIEHEYDPVVLDVRQARPEPDPAEVDACRRVPVAEPERELAGTPEAFTYWFRLAFHELRERGWTTTGAPPRLP